MFSLSLSETECPGILGGAGSAHTVIETFNFQVIYHTRIGKSLV